MIVCSPGTLEAATYDVATSTWTPVDLPPELASLKPIETGALLYPYAHVVGTVDGLIIVDAGPASGDYWKFDIRSNEWQRLADPPVQLDPAAHAAGQSSGAFDACLSGTDLFVAESANPITLDIGPPMADGLKVHALALSTPDAKWKTSESLTYDQLPVPELSCAPSGVLAYSSIPGRGAFWLDAAESRWTATQAQPAMKAEETVLTPLTWADAGLVGGLSRGTAALAFDPTLLEWATLPPLPAQPQVPRGSIGVDGALVFVVSGPYIDSEGQGSETDVTPGQLVTYVP